MQSYNLSSNAANTSDRHISAATANRRVASQRAFRDRIRAEPNWSRRRTQIPKWLIDYDQIDEGAKAAYMVLAGFADCNIFPSQKYLAERLGCSDREIRRRLKVLETEGMIRVTRTREKKAIGWRTTSHYWIDRSNRESRFAMVPREWIDDPSLSPKAKVVLAAICYVQGDSRFAWRRLADMKRLAGLTDGSFYRALHALETCGAITVDRTGPSETETDHSEYWSYADDPDYQLMPCKFGRRPIRVCRKRALSVVPAYRTDTLSDTLFAPPASVQKRPNAPLASGQATAKDSTGVRRIKSDPIQETISRSCNDIRSPLRSDRARDTGQNEKSDPKPEQTTEAKPSTMPANTYRQQLMKRCRARDAVAAEQRRYEAERRAFLRAQCTQIFIDEELARLDAVPDFECDEAPAFDV